MGYAKINKNKIQPSATLAFLNGLASGINAKKKEMQDREDAENKKAVDLYKYMQEQSIKERETQVKERTADVAERGATSEEGRVILESRKIDQAQQTINDNLNKTALDYKKFHLDLMKNITDPIEKEKFEILQNNLQKGLEDYKESIAEKADARKNKLLVAGQIAVETERQKGDIATQVMIQAGQDRRNREDNARMAAEGEKDRESRKEIALLRESPEGKSPEVSAFLKLFDDYQNEVVLTVNESTPKEGKGKNPNYSKTSIPPLGQQRLDQKYQLMMDIYNRIPDDIKPTAPLRFGGTPPEVKRWAKDVPSNYGYQGVSNPVGISINQNDYKKMISQKDRIKATYKTKQAAYEAMSSADNPMSGATIQKIVDDIYGK